MTTTINPKSKKEAQEYPPSFVDRLMAWIERLPVPTWGFYLSVTLLFVVLGHGLRWLDGSLQPGTFDPLRFANDSLTFYALAVLHILNSTARRSLEIFRPALGKLESEYERLQYELTTMPPRFVLITTGVGILLTAMSLASDPVAWGITKDTSLLTNIFSVAQASLATVSFIGFFAQAIRQLRLIGHVHRTATNINLYESGSHHAFSRLTVRVAVGLVFPIYYYSLIVILQFGRFTTMSAVDSSMAVVFLLVSAAVFILPLLGMRRRLVDEKERLLVEANRQFDAATRKLHQRLEAGDMEKMDDFNKALASLILEKDTLKKISTWPWEAETMRGFLSSVGLPILLWFVTTYLGRFFQ